MFISRKRHEQEKEDALADANRLLQVLLKRSGPGCFLIDAKGTLLPPFSASLTTLFRRDDFSNLTIEKLLAPLVTVKALTQFRAMLSDLMKDPPAAKPLTDVEMRLPMPDGSFEAAHYAFEFEALSSGASRSWLVSITDVTTQVQTARELDDLRLTTQAQGEVLRGILTMGAARFNGFLLKTEASMKTIATVIKKPSREDAAFRQKIAQIVDQVDQVRREAAVFSLSALETAARSFEDALQDLRKRREMSGNDFLPLAVKLDRLSGSFVLIKTLAAAAEPIDEPINEPQDSAPRTAGGLDGALHSLTVHVAQEQAKEVVLDSSGLQWVPSTYQSTIKNVAIQFIRNAVMHGIELPATRQAAGKPPRGRLRLEFRAHADRYELLFEDDGRGLAPDEARAHAVAQGILSAEAAARLRDREAIKLIFRSRYTTLPKTGNNRHGLGLSVVRRYIHAAGGKIALASLPGVETRFKITLPIVPAEASVEAPPGTAFPRGAGNE
jgi:signal transduction histidine kinase